MARNAAPASIGCSWSGIADQDELGAGFGHGFGEERHLTRRHHAGLVQDEDRLLVKTIAIVFPAQFPG